MESSKKRLNLKNWALRPKLITAFIIVLLVPSLLIGGISYVVAKNVLENQILNTAKGEVSQVNQKINSIIQPKMDELDYFTKTINDSLPL